MSAQTALLDAGVLYPAPMPDVLLQLAATVKVGYDVIVTANLKDFPVAA